MSHTATCDLDPHHRHGELGRRERHRHDHRHDRAPGRLADPSTRRSRSGIKAVAVTLAVLTVTAAAQTAIYVLVLSVALLADVIHNFGDALTAIPLGLAFLVRSARGERWAGLAVVATIFGSAVIALVQTIERLIHPEALTHLWWLAAAGVIGCAGNEIAAQIRLAAGRRLSSPALVADGNHARVDAFVSLGVLASAALVALGFEIADPIVGLVITLAILHVTWDSWHAVRAS